MKSSSNIYNQFDANFKVELYWSICNSNLKEPVKFSEIACFSSIACCLFLVYFDLAYSILFPEFDEQAGSPFD